MYIVALLDWINYQN